MALIKAIAHRPLRGSAPHTVAECTYSIVVEQDGSRLLQIDTYGSHQRELTGKKSQSIRFTKAALSALKQIMADHNL